MCDSSVIETKVNDFVSKNAMFTSVDIANAIKKDGTWVKNSEVASWLRVNVLANFSSYRAVRIPVAQGQLTAFLYYPGTYNPDDYQDRDQTALPPQQHVTDKFEISADKEGRFRIPAALVRELGWAPGDKVDKTRIITRQQYGSLKKLEKMKDISENLVVHKDGRIAILWKCVSCDDDPILVYIQNGNMIFEVW